MEKTYFDKLNNTINNGYLQKMEEYASINNVPIIQKEGLECLLLTAKLKNGKKVLEIGTATGYSSICFATKPFKRFGCVTNVCRNNLHNFSCKLSLIDGTN